MTMDVQTLSPVARQAIGRLLQDPIFEMIPLSNAIDQARYLPAGARLSVTASPNRTLDDSLDLAEALTSLGYRVTPHISAHMIRDRDHLGHLLSRIDGLGITTAFVVGGDAEVGGPYNDGLALLDAMDEIGHSLEVGVPCYPEGHPNIPDETLFSALAAKQPHASWMTSQMCFDPGALLKWTESARHSSIELPLVLGVPGVVDRMKLLRIASRIGVGQSLSFLRKNIGLVSAFAKPAGYDPGELLVGLGDHVADPSLGIVGCHIYTFNQGDRTEAWRRSFREALLRSRA
jgi:methylenetetrahydrofolate reductase (NADPH)